MVDETVAPTTRVAAVNVIVLDPAGTVTVAGTVTGSLAVSATTAPPAGAAVPRVTVPATLFPPTTLGALREIVSVADVPVTVIVDDRVVPLKVALIETVP